MRASVQARTRTIAQPGSLPPLVDQALLEGEDPVVRTSHKVYEQLAGLWAPAVIEAAHDLGLFDELARGPAGSGALADRVGADPRAVRVLVEALEAYELVGREHAPDGSRRYTLDPEVRQALLPGGMYSLYGKMVHDRRVAWNAWRRLATTVRTGSNGASDAGSTNQISEGDYEFLVTGINFWAPPCVGALHRELGVLGWSTDRAVRMLDVGCGSGVYSHLLLEQYPRWRSVGLDAGRIAPLANEQARQLQVADRFTCMACDFWQDDWRGPYDLVLLANIFHLQDRESAGRLASLTARALRPGGIVCIFDNLLDDDRRADSPQTRFALLFAASMLATGGGDAYSLRDYDDWFAAAGLRRRSVRRTPMHHLIIAGR